MALKIQKVSETSLSAELGESLWLTEDRSEVVQEGDPRAAFLLGTAGKRIPLEQAEELGLLKKGAKAVEAPAEDKAAASDADKEAKPEADKALVKDIVANIGSMSDDELDALKSDKRAGVVKARKAELAARKAKADQA